MCEGHLISSDIIVPILYVIHILSYIICAYTSLVPLEAVAVETKRPELLLVRGGAWVVPGFNHYQDDVEHYNDESLTMMTIDDDDADDKKPEVEHRQNRKQRRRILQLARPGSHP